MRTGLVELPTATPWRFPRLRWDPEVSNLRYEDTSSHDGAVLTRVPRQGIEGLALIRPSHQICNYRSLGPILVRYRGSEDESSVLVSSQQF